MPAPAALLEQLVARFRPEASEGMSATYQLHLTGDDGGEWHLVVAERRCRLTAGRAAEPDVAITISVQDWEELTEGRLDPVSALFSGRIQIAGDLSLASRLQSLFGF
jgi:putative sterol carrier protein